MSHLEEYLVDIVVKTVFCLFKERPWAAYLVVAGIYILALSILLTQVQDPSTMTIIAFALGFILFVAAREFNRGVRQSSAKRSLESSGGQEAEPLLQAGPPATVLFAATTQEAPARTASAWLLPALVSAMAAGASAALPRANNCAGVDRLRDWPVVWRGDPRRGVWQAAGAFFGLVYGNVRCFV